MFVGKAVAAGVEYFKPLDSGSPRSLRVTHTVRSWVTFLSPGTMLVVTVGMAVDGMMSQYPIASVEVLVGCWVLALALVFLVAIIHEWMQQRVRLRDAEYETAAHREELARSLAEQEAVLRDSTERIVQEREIIQRDGPG